MWPTDSEWVFCLCLWHLYSHTIQITETAAFYFDSSVPSSFIPLKMNCYCIFIPTSHCFLAPAWNMQPYYWRVQTWMLSERAMTDIWAHMNDGAQDQTSDPKRKHVNTIPGLKCPPCSLFSSFCTPPVSWFLVLQSWYIFTNSHISSTVIKTIMKLRKSSWAERSMVDGPTGLVQQLGWSCDGRNFTPSRYFSLKRKEKVQIIKRIAGRSCKVECVSDNCCLFIFILWVKTRVKRLLLPSVFVAVF